MFYSFDDEFEMMGGLRVKMKEVMG
jgi:hypothetical protein